MKFDLSSLAFSTAADLKDSEVTVSLGDEVLGTFPVDNTIGTAIFDEYGTASVDVVLPAGTPGRHGGPDGHAARRPAPRCWCR